MSHPSRREAHSAIQAVLERHYFRGMDELSFETFAPAFHPTARISFVDESGLVPLDLAGWQGRLAALRADADHPLHHEESRKSIEAIEVAGDVACATVRFHYPSRVYTDFLLFAEVDGRWRITSKTFHLELLS